MCLVVDELWLQNQLCFALYAASHAMTRAYVPLLEKMGGLTYPQYAVLMVLWERDGLVVGEVAERLALDASTVTPLVRRMERLGLLSRQRSAGDERRVEVRLTDVGRALRAEARHVRETMLSKTGLSRAAAGELRDQLQQLFAFLTAARAARAPSHSSRTSPSNPKRPRKKKT
jgi:MarR family transcriptional regulator, organic hydroperoxide resistance regulator